jgi:hypothetical protein
VTDVGFDRSMRRRPPRVWAHYHTFDKQAHRTHRSAGSSETAAFSCESTVGLRCEAGMIERAASALRSKSGRIMIGDARTRGARRTRVVARRPRSLVWSRPLPHPERDRNGIDVDPRPPRRLVAVAMQFAMMRATDGDRVFVAGLSSERAGLGKTKMVRVGRRAAAHDARLAGHESGMLLVAQANGLPNDAAADGVDFLGDLSKGADAVFRRRRAGLGRERLDRRRSMLLGGGRFQLRLEAAFDEFRVGGSSADSCRASPMNPVHRLVGAREVIQFGDQAIA